MGHSRPPCSRCGLLPADRSPTLDFPATTRPVCEQQAEAGCVLTALVCEMQIVYMVVANVYSAPLAAQVGIQVLQRLGFNASAKPTSHSLFLVRGCPVSLFALPTATNLSGASPLKSEIRSSSGDSSCHKQTRTPSMKCWWVYTYKRVEFAAW